MILVITLHSNMASSIILLSPATLVQNQRTFTVILKVLDHVAHLMATPLVKYLHNQSYWLNIGISMQTTCQARMKLMTQLLRLLCSYLTKMEMFSKMAQLEESLV